MARRNVSNLMRQHTGQLIFVGGVIDQPGIGKQASSGQAERVDLIGIEHFDTNRDAQIAMLGNAVRDVLHEVLQRFGIAIRRQHPVGP